jgi:PAS domain S-box-containing protein
VDLHGVCAARPLKPFETARFDRGAVVARESVRSPGGAFCCMIHHQKMSKRTLFPSMWGIGAKLYCFALVALFAVAMLSITSIHFLRKIDAEARQLYDVSFKGVTDASRIDSLLERHRRIVETMPSEMERRRIELRRVELDQINKTLSELARGIGADEVNGRRASREAHIGKNLTGLFEAAKHVSFYSYQFAQDKATEQVGEYADIADRLQILVKSYRDQRMREAKASIASVDTTTRQLVLWIVVCGLAAIVAIGPIGLATVHRTVRRLSGLTGAILRVACHETATVIPSRDDRDEVGAVARAVEVFRDTAARLIAREAELDSLNNRIDVALNNMTHGLCMFDAEFRLIVCNEAYVRMYGLTPELAQPGTPLPAIERHRSAIGNNVVTSAESSATATSARARDGLAPIEELADGRIVAVSLRPMPNGGWVAVHEDITRNSRIEDERDRNREFLNQIIDNIPAGLVVKDANTGRYVLINRATEQMWGILRSEAIGKTPYDFLSAEQADELVRLDKVLAASSEPIHSDEHPSLWNEKNPRIVVSTRFAIRDRSRAPQYFATVIQDVTERKKLRQQLQQAQKMEAVGNLTGGIAHDFNNLLMIIISNLDLLRMDVAGNPDAVDTIERITQAGLRGSELTSQLLAFSRRKVLRPKTAEVGELLSNAFNLLRRTLNKNIEFVVREENELWPIFVDEAELESAFVNISLNARDAMPDGGTLTVGFANVHAAPDGALARAGLVAGDYVSIEISDTGTGIPQEAMVKIFEPFYTTKGVGKGSGLGLAMVYGFIQQSGGYIDVTSEVGRGTTFTLYLPRSNEQRVDAANKKPSADKANLGRNELILAVDDDHEVRRAVVAQLRSLGYRVLEVDNAVAALDRLLDMEDIDLLFTDVIMPGEMNGKQLATRARAIRPALKILFTSGFPGQSLADDVEMGESDGWLHKPYRRGDLAKAVREVLDASSEPAASAGIGTPEVSDAA